MRAALQHKALTALAVIVGVILVIVLLNAVLPGGEHVAVEHGRVVTTSH